MTEGTPGRGASPALRHRLGTAPMIGTFAALPHPAVAEVLGRAGFEAVCLDAEHGAFGLDSIAEGIRAAEGAGTYPLVRVAEPGTVVSQVLDAGAAGVMAPRVESAEDARRLASFARYPPVGSRGIGLGRSAGYGTGLGAERAELDSRSYVIAQIETVRGTANIEQICGVAGIDMIFVGPADLAWSMGEPMWSPPHAKLVADIISRAAACGMATGLFCTDPKQIVDYAPLGVKLFLVSADVLMLQMEAAKVLRAALTSLADPA